jgi:hypothetical protein
LLSEKAMSTGFVDPISAAIDFDSLRRSGDPEKRQLSEVLNGLTEIKVLLERFAPEKRTARSILQDQIARKRLAADIAREFARIPVLPVAPTQQHASSDDPGQSAMKGSDHWPANLERSDPSS